MTAPTLYRIVDVFDYLDREDEYTGLTLEEAAHRMDDLTGVGADVILSDWEEPCVECEGRKQIPTGECLVAMSGPTCFNADCPPCQTPELDPCPVCGGDGKWAGPWKWTDPESGREVTMMREVG